MSGTENFGPKAAFKELLPHHIIVLTDLEQSGEFQAAMAKEIFIALKMNIIKMDSNRTITMLPLLAIYPISLVMHLQILCFLNKTQKIFLHLQVEALKVW